LAAGLALLLGTTTLFGGAQPAVAAPAKVWTESAYASVFKDSGPSADAGTAVRLDTARNDYEGGQVALRMTKSFTITSVSFSALKAGKRAIAADNLSYNFVGYEHLDNNSAFGDQDVNPVIRTAPGDFPDRLLNDPQITEVIGKDPKTGAPIRDFPQTESATTDKWLSQYIPALKAHIEAKGWAPIFQTQITDEPGTEYDTSELLKMMAKMRQYWPDIKLGDAIPHEPFATQLAPTQDIVIPEELNYNTNPKPYDLERQHGKDLWFYNCIIPVGNYLNRLIDQPEWNQRLSMWWAYSKNMNGYLHWAMSNWQYEIGAEASKGDGFIVRPDKAHNTVEVSPRYESLRDGIEDWEVLNILGKSHPGLAKDLAAALVPRADKYTPDTAYMQRVRAMVLDAAAGKPVIAHDPALAQPATASSQTAGFPAGRAVDGKAWTGWQPVTADGTQWLQVDLRKQVQLDGVRLHWGSVYGKSYHVKISYDGKQWADAYATSSADGGDDFVGINGKARYVRVEVSGGSAGAQPYQLTDLQVAGHPLAKPNLAGGKTYTKTYPDGTEATPSARFPDTGNESTDGLLGDAWDDGRAYGYELTNGQPITVNVTVDLGAVQRVGSVRTHAYEEYPYYRPDLTTASTSQDGQTFTPRGQLSATNGESQVWYDFAFAPANARYVRLTFTKTGSAKGTGVFLDDIEAYAP
jgi:hypothetical protein